MTELPVWNPPNSLGRLISLYRGLDYRTALLRDLRTYLDTHVPGEFTLGCYTNTPTLVLITWTDGLPARDLAALLAPDTDLSTPVSTVTRTAFTFPLALRLSRRLTLPVLYAGVDRILATRCGGVAEAMNHAAWTIDPGEIPLAALAAWSSLPDVDARTKLIPNRHLASSFTQLQPRVRDLVAALA